MANVRDQPRFRVKVSERLWGFPADRGSRPSSLQASRPSPNFTRPSTPKTNGKAERLIGTALREWATLAHHDVRKNGPMTNTTRKPTKLAKAAAKRGAAKAGRRRRTAPKSQSRKAEGPALLAGGNPQIAKAYG